MQLPDMNLLVALDALLDEGSVVGAARRMNLSPAAMSRTLTRIREAVGDPILVRAGRGLVPTPKALELQGWNYPKHLAGRAYGLVVHGDVAGIEGVRRGLSDWLDWMGLVDAGAKSRLDRYIGYYDTYAQSHETLDRDTDMQEEVRNVARAVADAVKRQRAGTLAPPDAALQAPRPK